MFPASDRAIRPRSISSARRIAGKVTRIGSIVGKNQLVSIDPRAMRDLRVVEVTIAARSGRAGESLRRHGG